jgi:hypothetical protein
MPARRAGDEGIHTQTDKYTQKHKHTHTHLTAVVAALPKHEICLDDFLHLLILPQIPGELLAAEVFFVLCTWGGMCEMESRRRKRINNGAQNTLHYTTLHYTHPLELT